MLDKIIDEIYEHEKLKTKQEAGIIPDRTLPKNIYFKESKIMLTSKPTRGEIEIHAEEDGEMNISCHKGYEGGRDDKKLFCKIKDLNKGLD